MEAGMAVGIFAPEKTGVPETGLAGLFTNCGLDTDGRTADGTCMGSVPSPIWTWTELGEVIGTFVAMPWETGRDVGMLPIAPEIGTPAAGEARRAAMAGLLPGVAEFTCSVGSIPAAGESPMAGGGGVFFLLCEAMGAPGDRTGAAAAG